MRPIRFLAYLLTAYVSQAAIAATTTDDTVVAAFYPDRLLTAFAEPTLVEQSYRFFRADLDGTGTRAYIVALYSNGGQYALRVLHASDGARTLVADPTEPFLSGTRATLTLRDLDGDGRPEIVVTTSEERASQAWIFSWASGALRLASPVEDVGSGVTSSPLINAQFEDVDGDGVVDVIVPATRSTPPVLKTYAFKGGGFVRASDIAFRESFSRSDGPPEYVQESIAATPDTYTFTVLNGDPDGKNRVTSGDVVVNGKSLFSDDDFKRNTKTLTATVTLADENTVYVELRGAPGSRMALTARRLP